MTIRRAPAILNWAGSKALVAKFLSELDLPQVPTYHEPFLGSGAAYLALASAGVISKGRAFRHQSSADQCLPVGTENTRECGSRPTPALSLRLGCSFLGSIGAAERPNIARYRRWTVGGRHDLPLVPVVPLHLVRNPRWNGINVPTTGCSPIPGEATGRRARRRTPAACDRHSGRLSECLGRSRAQ
jgi:hypothetical protein